MEQENQSVDRPVIVWESAGKSGQGEAGLQVIQTGQSGESGAPVIRVFSSGFGQQQTACLSRAVRMAA